MKIDHNDFLAKMFLLFNALFLIVTGVFLITATDVEIQSPTYELMARLMNLDGWGIVFGVSGFLFLAASFQEGRIKFLSMLIGGVLGGAVFMLYTAASVEGAVNMMVPVRYGVIAGFELIIAGVGGFCLWRDRRVT